MVLIRDSTRQVNQWLVLANTSDGHFGRDPVARPNRSREIPVDIDEYRTRSRKLLRYDSVEQATGHAALNDDATESGESGGLPVVMKRIAIT